MLLACTWLLLVWLQFGGGGTHRRVVLGCCTAVIPWFFGWVRTGVGSGPAGSTTHLHGLAFSPTRNPVRGQRTYEIEIPVTFV